MSIDAAGTRYWTGSRRRRPRQRPDRDDRGGGPRLRHPTGWSSIAAIACRSRRAAPRRGGRPAWVGDPILADGDPVRRARAPTRDLPGGGPAHDPPRGMAVGRARLRRGGRRPRVLRRPDRLPKAGGHRLLRRRRAQPARGPGPRERRAVELRRRRRSSSRDRPSRSGCRCRRSSRAIPMALLGADLRCRAGVERARRRDRAGPRLAARGRRGGRERGLPTGRARTLALGTGVTTAVYLPLVLHAALPDSTMPFAALALAAALLMTRLARDPRGARLVRSATHRPGRAPRAGGADPQRGGLAGPRLGRRGGVSARRRSTSARPPHRRRRRRRPPRLRAVGASRLGRVRQPAPRPGGRPTPCR